MRGKALDAVGERPHAAGQRFLVEPMREIGRPAVDCLELGQPLRQELLAFIDPPLRLGERGLRHARPLHRPSSCPQPVERLGGSCCSRFRRSSDSPNGLEPARLDQRLAGQAQQPIEVLAADPQDHDRACREAALRRRLGR